MTTTIRVLQHELLMGRPLPASGLFMNADLYGGSWWKNEYVGCVRVRETRGDHFPHQLLKVLKCWTCASHQQVSTASGTKMRWTSGMTPFPIIKVRGSVGIQRMNSRWKNLRRRPTAQQEEPVNKPDWSAWMWRFVQTTSKYCLPNLKPSAGCSTGRVCETNLNDGVCCWA